MQSYRQNLILLITNSDLDIKTEAEKLIVGLDSKSLAALFVDVSFLITALEFIDGQYWIEDLKNDDEEKKVIIAQFIKKYFKSELRPLLFFQSTLDNTNILEIKSYQKNVLSIQKTVVGFVKKRQFPENRNFAIAALNSMSELFEFEHQMTMKKDDLNQNLNYTLYRSFDSLDECFNLNYESEHADTESKTIERISLQSGVGVQSSYSALLMALRYINLPMGSRFVDLGSGFGRVGIVVGLLRPDIQFFGYEFVENRVDVANKAISNLGLQDKVSFIQQDLSDQNFEFPEAETYYIYDPFTEETYKHIISKVTEVAARKKINVITKGNAKLHFLNAVKPNTWSKPQEFKTGNFCLFRSN